MIWLKPIRSGCKMLKIRAGHSARIPPDDSLAFQIRFLVDFSVTGDAKSMLSVRQLPKFTPWNWQQQPVNIGLNDRLKRKLIFQQTPVF